MSNKAEKTGSASENQTPRRDPLQPDGERASDEPRTFHVTLYRNDVSFGTVVDEKVYSWDDLAWFLQDSAESIESLPCTLGDENSEKRAKAKLPAWGPHRLVAGAKRARMGVVAVTLLAADIDHATQEEVDRIAELAAGRALIVYGSPRDGKDGERRVRVVGLPSREMTPAESDRARIAFATELGFDAKKHGVTGALGAERLFFVGRLAGLEPREFGVLNGEPWDVDALLASAPAEVAIVSTRGAGPRGAKREAKIRLVPDALGDHHDHIGRRSNLCNAIGGQLRQDGATAAFCKEVIEKWLAGADVEQNDKDAIKRGVDRALGAWKKAPHQVTGADAFYELLDTKEHADRVIEAIRKATGIASMMKPTPAPAAARELVAHPIEAARPPLVLVEDKQGRPLRNAENVKLCLAYWFTPDAIRFETTRGRTVCGAIDPSYGDFPEGPWTDDHTTELECLCNRNGLQVEHKTVARVAKLHAEKHKFNAIADWLIQCAQEWDGVPRVDAALAELWGCEPGPATNIASRIFFLSLAARGLMPGCKCDYCVTFVGDQGLRKSSSFLELVGAEWFSDDEIPQSDGEAVKRMRGKWLWENAENANMPKRDRNQRKKFITKQGDQNRELFVEQTEDVPRVTVFVATTNDDEILDDPTGNRRFPIVRVVRASNLKAIRELRVQLMGEAATRVIRGEVEFPDADDRPAELRWWPTADEERVLDAVRAEHVVTDVWDESIERFAAAQEKPFSLLDALATVGQLVTKVTRREENRAADILRRLGYERFHAREGKRWRRKT